MNNSQSFKLMQRLDYRYFTFAASQLTDHILLYTPALKSGYSLWNAVDDSKLAGNVLNDR
jgi:hypothetical protein